MSIREVSPNGEVLTKPQAKIKRLNIIKRAPKNFLFIVENFIKFRQAVMENRLNIEITLTQKLKLTPKQVLSLKLLQLPLVKLEEKVKKEFEENPLIEPIDFVYEESFHYYEERKEETEKAIPSSTTVREALLEQVNLELSGIEREIGKFIVENLNERGLLEIPLEEIAQKFNATADTVNSVREKIKNFSPAGCGSLSVKELIESQLKEMGAPQKFTEALKELELLTDIERFKWETGLTQEEVEEFLSLLKRVELYPLKETVAVRVKPDLKVWLEKGEVKVEVKMPNWLKFNINKHYLQHATREELRKYIKEKYQRALFLKRAIESREETLKRIAQEVFKVQKDFLKDGKTLKPLSLTEVAAKLSLHESTVSRGVKDKFVETPFGIFPLKAFFKKGISGKAVEVVKEEIKRIIESEDKKRPLSDGKIAELLKEKGIKIARRTVAKYREEMGIPGAYKRRKR